MKTLIISVVLLVAPMYALASVATQLSDEVICQNAIEISYSFIDRMNLIRPELAYAPVRSFEQTALFRLSCMDGIRTRKERNRKKLDALFEQIENSARRKFLSPLDARFIVNDMAMVLSFQAGYFRIIK